MKAASNPTRAAEPSHPAFAQRRRRQALPAQTSNPHEDAVIALALRIIESRMRSAGPLFDAPGCVKDYLRMQLGHLEHEVFAALFLDARHRLIEFRVLFRGTLTQTRVYAREVAKEALALGAASLVLAHNHPSGTAEPSPADEDLTVALKIALKLVDVCVLDHMIVAGEHVVSFDERGLL